ncbi:MAG TPA: hypothetical protein VHD15_10850 [Hyphomicrobiales bacterium]|nr:hypothetical protein [Hyphomicrobiales bacterium]
MKAASAEFVNVVSGSLTVSGTFSGGEIDGGTVQVGTLNGAIIKGGAVHAASLGGSGLTISGGSLDVPAITLHSDTQGGASFLADGGTVTTGSLTVGASDETETDAMDIASGSHVTVTGAATVGLGGVINVGKDTLSGSGATGGGTLSLQDGLSIVSSATIAPVVTSEAGATLKVAGAVVVDTADVSDPGLDADGGTISLTGTLTLGKAAGGEIKVEDGGTASVSTVVAGAKAGTSGTLFVDGAGSQLDASGPVTLGEAGTGNMTVRDGAQASLATLTAGEKGTAFVNINTSAAASVATLVIAAAKGSSGSVGVGLFNAGSSSDASGGTLTVAGAVTVGESGTGEIDIYGGSRVKATTLTAGAENGANGTVTVGYGKTSHTEARLAVTGAATFGEKGHGSLTISAGGAATAGSLAIGTESSGSGKSLKQSQGAVIVKGAHATLDVTDTLTVGEAGKASLGVANKGAVTAGTLEIAGAAAPAGGKIDGTTGLHTQNIRIVTVGTNGTLDAGNLTVGEKGYAQLFATGGTVTTSGTGEVASAAKSEGEVQLDNAGWTAATLTIGGSGKALVEAGHGGSLTSSGATAIGEAKGGSGTVALGDGTAGDGAGSLTVGAKLVVGGGGKGTLVADASAVSVGGASIVVGEEKGGSGALTLHGSSLSFAGTLTVGEGGSGTLVLDGGAAVGSAKQAVTLALGEKAGASGSVTLDGQGTRMVLKSLDAGAHGKGSIKITDGATLTAKSAEIATAVGKTADTVSLDTAGRLIVSGNLAVGDQGFASLSAKGGSAVSVTNTLTLGEAAGSSGSVTFAGGATATAAAATTLKFGTLEVGGAGVGTLTISGGATATATKAGGTVEIAAEAGSTGKLTLTGAGSALTGKSLAVGGTAEAAGGSATVTIAAAAVATFASAHLWKGDKLTLSGGSLHVAGSIEGNGTIAIDQGGTLILGGHAEKAVVSFLAGSSGASLQLGAAAELGAAVRGFAKGDSIKIGGLDQEATFSVKASGANTVVTLTDHGKDAGNLTLAGHFTAANLHLEAGVLTTTAAGAKADAVTIATTSGADHLQGTGAADSLAGEGGADVLRGSAGPDVLDGGLGRDTLTGGAGHDTFVFDSKLTGANVDRITDFAPGVDRIELDHAVFAALTPGALPAVDFAEGAAARTASQHILYDASTGALSYDADGKGGHAAIEFAVLGSHLHLTAADFLVA